MADLGAKGTLIGAGALFSRPVPSTGVRKLSYPLLPGEGQEFLNVDVLGSISGTVKLNGAAQQNIRVGLIYRSNLNVIAITLTDAFGAYSFAGLDRSDAGNYVVVVLDGKADAPYNYSLVRDHLTAG